MTQQDRTWVVVLVVTVLIVLRAIAGVGREPNAPLGQQRADGGATIALAVLGVVGTLGGVWWGQVLADKSRRRGEVRREVRAWVEETTSTTGDTETRTFDMRFYNDRDVNVAL
jgi:hypothetical protein